MLTRKDGLEVTERFQLNSKVQEPPRSSTEGLLNAIMVSHSKLNMHEDGR